ncbi:MAG: hypothetical protein COA33_011560 [Fluviicola sp.]|nr:hypothetical protein [Fluviicola sp.]
MALDPMMTDALLGTFRNMVQEIKEKQSTGEDVDKMNEYFDRMVELTQTHSDMSAFNGQMMQENLYMKFSDHYGRVLSQAAVAEQEEKGYDDSTLLKQSIDALKMAIKRLQDGKQEAIALAREDNSEEIMEKTANIASSQGTIKMSKKDLARLKKRAFKESREDLAKTPNMYNDDVEVDVLNNIEPIVEAIQNLIDLGETEGMTLPRFLSTQMEKGLDKAMEGLILVRDACEGDVAFQKAYALSPYHIQKAEETVKVYDQLAEQSTFNIPESDELEFCTEKLDYKYEKDINKWEEIVNRWEEILDDLSEWSLSYTSVAPYIDPWKGADNPKKATIESQKILPGIIQERIRLLNKYFGVSFEEIFAHPTFKWKVEQFTISNSQEFVEFLKNVVYVQCKPFADLSKGDIDERLKLYNEKRELNPEHLNPLKRYISYYDNKFGEGRYQSKNSIPEQGECNAKAWVWSEFGG